MSPHSQSTVHTSQIARWENEGGHLLLDKWTDASVVNWQWVDKRGMRASTVDRDAAAQARRTARHLRYSRLTV